MGGSGLTGPVNRLGVPRLLSSSREFRILSLPKDLTGICCFGEISEKNYLTEQEFLTCEDNVTLAQLTQKHSTRRRLESNAGPYPERQKKTRDEHEIYPADPDATVAHSSSSVRWRGAGQKRRGRRRP